MTDQLWIAYWSFGALVLLGIILVIVDIAFIVGAISPPAITPKPSPRPRNWARHTCCGKRIELPSAWTFNMWHGQRGWPPCAACNKLRAERVREGEAMAEEINW